MLRIWNPDDVTVAQLFSDSKLYMDLALKTLKLARTVGPEKVKVTSVGAADSESMHIDAWQRKWQLRVYRVPFADWRIVSLALPLPDGCASLLRIAPGGQSDIVTADLKLMADFLAVTYWGKLEDWVPFLADKALLPAAFADFEISIDYDKRFRFGSRRLQLGVQPDFLKVTPRSGLSLKFAFFLDQGTPVWDVAGVAYQEDTSRPTYVDVTRDGAPQASLPETYQEYWKRETGRTAPFDRRRYSDSDTFEIAATITATDRLSKPLPADTPVLYAVTFGIGGTPSDREMKSALSKALAGVTVLE
ncbi:MAG: hypothetical protein HC872_05285 [Gammaproteobacteria bacterium]|nr:hypothetical protein [Gammaproteobacteria bacterium]